MAVLACGVVAPLPGRQSCGICSAVRAAVRLRELFAPAAGKTVLRSEFFALALTFALTARVAHADVSGQGEGTPDDFAEARAAAKPHDPVHVSVKLTGDTTCIDHARLKEEIERALERPVFVDERFELVLELGVAQASDAPGYVATLRLSDERGHPLGKRRIESHEPACSLLFERVALAVTLMVDLRHDELEKVTPPPAKAPPEQLPAPEPSASETTSTTSPPARAFELDSVRLGTLATWGLFPDLTWGVLLSPRARVLRVPFELRGAFWPRRSFLAEGERFDLQALSFGAACCPTLLERPVLEREAAFEVCAEVDALRTVAHGKSLDHNAEATLWSAAPGASLAGVWKVLPPLAVRAAAGARVLSPRGKFVIVDETGSDVTLYEASPVLGTVELGLVLEL